MPKDLYFYCPKFLESFHHTIEHLLLKRNSFPEREAEGLTVLQFVDWRFFKTLKKGK